MDHITETLYYPISISQKPKDCYADSMNPICQVNVKPAVSWQIPTLNRLIHLGIVRTLRNQLGRYVQLIEYQVNSRLCYWEIGHHRGMIANEHFKIGSNSYKKVKTFKYLGSLLTNQNSIQEIKCRLQAENSCYYSVQTLFSSRLL